MTAAADATDAVFCHRRVATHAHVGVIWLVLPLRVVQCFSVCCYVAAQLHYCIFLIACFVRAIVAAVIVERMSLNPGHVCLGPTWDCVLHPVRCWV